MVNVISSHDLKWIIISLYNVYSLPLQKKSAVNGEKESSSKICLHSQTNINLTFAATIISILSLRRSLYLCEQIPVCLSRAFMSTAFAQFIRTEIDCITGIMILLDAVTFVYPLHFAKMSSHWNSFECIKSSGLQMLRVEKNYTAFSSWFSSNKCCVLAFEKQ